MVLGIGGVAALGTSRMGGGPAIAVEDLDRSVCNARLHALAHQAVRYGIPVPVHMDVAIEPRGIWLCVWAWNMLVGLWAIFIVSV